MSDHILQIIRHLVDDIYLKEEKKIGRGLYSVVPIIKSEAQNKYDI